MHQSQRCPSKISVETKTKGLCQKRQKLQKLKIKTKKFEKFPKARTQFPPYVAYFFKHQARMGLSQSAVKTVMRIERRHEKSEFVS